MRPKDLELNVLQKIYLMLVPFNHSNRTRMLSYLRCRLGIRREEL